MNPPVSATRFTSPEHPAAAGIPAVPTLRECIARHAGGIPSLADVDDRLQALSPAGGGAMLEALIALYETCYPLLEQAMWSGVGDFHALLAIYQALFREQESLIRQCAVETGITDDRHRFIIAIPVADRPPHLRACLESILQVCTLFGYGGKKSGVWDRITVVVAEDSRDENNIRRHQDLAAAYRRKGLRVIHFGLEEQYVLLEAIPPDARERLGKLLTTQPRERFYLKGQAANRNLSYLKLRQLTENRDRTLYYFIDSDESLCVSRQTASGDEVVYALNYFHAIDKIFRTTDVLMLTGKMVGDPPVSPSVMAANFLDDVIAFFTRLGAQAGGAGCTFHDPRTHRRGDAPYHDMAALFGFADQAETYPYACRLTDEHDHAACLVDFAQRLSAFFFGEHLTRKTWFEYGAGFGQLTPARTVYPGNYVVRHDGLKYAIPFGHLRLRMSGPAAGRLIAAEIGERFASFNMPNLHRRTTEAGLADDFRPGVEVGAARIDISDEFERQFFGDLMLFSTETLVRRADVRQPVARDVAEAIVAEKEAELLALYQQKHDAIVERNRKLDTLVFGRDHWWLHAAGHLPALAHALQQIRAFIDDIDHNFGAHAPAWRQIQSVQHRDERKRQIVEALLHYRVERDAWDGLF